MFERDKAELRDLGIPLETGRNSHFDSEDGYRITRRDYELPPIEFDAAEAAAVGLAARLWQSATLGEPARAALMKLRAAGTDVQDERHARRRARTSTPATRACRRCSRRRAGAAGPIRLRQVRSGNRAAPHARTLGRAVVAKALVRRRASTATAASRAASGCPASPARSSSSARRRVRASRRRSTCSSMVAGRARRGRPSWRASGSPGPAPAAAPHRRRRGRRRARRSPSPTLQLAGPADRQRRARRRRCSNRPSSSTPSSPGCRAAAGAASMTAATRSGCRGCSRWCRTCRPTRASASPRPPPTSASPRPAAPRPAAAVDVRAARPRPGRSDRPVLRGRDGLGDLRRRHVAAAAADRRGGARAGRRAAHAGRDAGAGRQRRRAARAGQGRDAPPAGAVDDATVTVALDDDRRGCCRCCTAPSTRSARCGCATTPRRATRPPSASSTRCASSSSTGTPTSRRGAAAPRACGSSGVDRIEDVELLDEPARPPAGLELRDLAEGVFQPASEHLLADAAAVGRLRLGGRLLPDRGGHRGRRRLLQVSLRVAEPAWVRVAGAGLRRPGRGALARLAGRVDPRRRRARPSPPIAREVEFCVVIWIAARRRGSARVVLALRRARLLRLRDLTGRPRRLRARPARGCAALRRVS